MADETAFDSLKGKVPDEEIEAFASYAQEGREEFQTTGHLSSLVGLKTFGVTDEGVKSAIALGSQLVKQGHLHKAAEYFGTLALLEPFHPQVFFWMGLTAHKLKTYDAAYVAYQQAIQMGSNDGCAHLYAGECLLMMGQHEDGLALLRTGLEKAARNPRLRAQVQRAERMLALQMGNAHG